MVDIPFGGDICIGGLTCGRPRIVSGTVENIANV